MENTEKRMNRTIESFWKNYFDQEDKIIAKLNESGLTELVMKLPNKPHYSVRIWPQDLI